jgi:hypothetical protein
MTGSESSTRALQALSDALVAGISIRVDGADLKLDAAARPPDHIIAAISSNKQAIIRLLRPDGAGWSAVDWHAYVLVRTDFWLAQGDTAEEAKRKAIDDCVNQWLFHDAVAIDDDHSRKLAAISSGDVHEKAISSLASLGVASGEAVRGGLKDDKEGPE